MTGLCLRGRRGESDVEFFELVGTFSFPALKY